MTAATCSPATSLAARAWVSLMFPPPTIPTASAFTGGGYSMVKVVRRMALLARRLVGGHEPQLEGAHAQPFEGDALGLPRGRRVRAAEGHLVGGAHAHELLPRPHLRLQHEASAGVAAAASDR